MDANSILTSTKKLAGIMQAEIYDIDVITYINSVFLILKQLGVGPVEGFYIEDDSATWEEFLPDDKILLNSTKAYMVAKVRKQFDPPTSSALLEALNSTINEFEWRLNVEAETP